MTEGWWFARSIDSEHLSWGGATREDAEATAREEYDGAPFALSRASQQPWRYDCFDRLDEEFDNANEELGDGDGDPPAIAAGLCTYRSGVPQELTDRLEAVLRAWIEENGKSTAWALDVHEQIEVGGTPEWQAREARRVAEIRSDCAAASVDTHPQGGDANAAPFMSGAVGGEADEAPKSQSQSPGQSNEG